MTVTLELLSVQEEKEVRRQVSRLSRMPQSHTLFSCVSGQMARLRVIKAACTIHSVHRVASDQESPRQKIRCSQPIVWTRVATPFQNDSPSGSVCEGSLIVGGRPPRIRQQANSDDNNCRQYRGDCYVGEDSVWLLGHFWSKLGGA